MGSPHLQSTNAKKRVSYFVNIFHSHMNFLHKKKINKKKKKKIPNSALIK
jgi:hypothetical protein